MGREHEILKILNDCSYHSGEALAEHLGVSRAAVWKAIRVLAEQGVDIHAVRGRGYRLPEPLEFLDRERIAADLDPEVRSSIHSIEVHERLDSTNSYLVNGAKLGLPSGSACLAEAQLAGRGRHNRPWVSPFAANLYLSLLWRFEMEPALLTGLSLATGVAVIQALAGLGVQEVGLKWPNDVLWQERKLGGILLEFGGESSGPCHIVVGVGLNVAMPPEPAAVIDQPWVDLRAIVGRGHISRNQVAARVLSEIARAFGQFERDGLERLREEWQRFDLTADKRVRVRLPCGDVTGIARGVDEFGALMLETTSGMQRLVAGEVSLRFEE